MTYHGLTNDQATVLYRNNIGGEKGVMIIVQNDNRLNGWQCRHLGPTLEVFDVDVCYKRG